jgi:hypothetical protein
VHRASSRRSCCARATLDTGLTVIRAGQDHVGVRFAENFSASKAELFATVAQPHLE